MTELKTWALAVAIAFGVGIGIGECAHRIELERNKPPPVDHDAERVERFDDHNLPLPEPK